MLEIVLASIFDICLVAITMVYHFLNGIADCINENKWLKELLEDLDLTLPIIAMACSSTVLSVLAVVVGVLLLIAFLFDKDNTVFDYFGKGFEISNEIKNKKWKKVLGLIFSNFDEIIVVLKKIF